MRGLPPTGRPVQFPLCGVFTFDAENRLAGEKIYYDRATVLHQLGVFHEPDGVVGRIEAVMMPADDGTGDRASNFAASESISTASSPAKDS